MAAYTFSCDGCGSRKTIDALPSEHPEHLLCACGTVMERDFAGMRLHVISNCVDYVSSEFTGAPIRVNTLREEKYLCEKHGVTRCTSDDLRGMGRKEGVEVNPESMKVSCERAAQELGVNA